MLAILVFILSGCLQNEESDTSNESSETTTGSQNSPPSVSGSPDNAVLVGDTYDFAPTANDPDGDTITFTIGNRPSWSTFDTSTGQLTGQPSLGDIGIYANIAISASDGNDSVDLPQFSIEVTQTALGSMTLSWSAPTQNDDGSALTDLAGYRLYFGTASGNYSNQVTIDNASISSYVIENLLPDTYYVVATAYNLTGVESRYSGEAVEVVEAL